MQGRHYLWVALATSLLGSTAQAQDPALETPVPDPAAEPVADPAADPAAEEPSKASEDPMGWFGVGFKLGVAGIGESEIDAGGPVKVKTDSRSGFQLAVPIHLGGDGFSWIFEPYLNLDSDVTATGLYTGPMFNIHIMDPLYVGFGFGLKAATLSGDNFDAGLDVGGRIPITGTYYLLDDIGLTAELGLGYTASGYKPKKVTGAAEPELNFGSAFAWDFSVGVRWP